MTYCRTSWRLFSPALWEIEVKKNLTLFENCHFGRLYTIYWFLQRRPLSNFQNCFYSISYIVKVVKLGINSVYTLSNPAQLVFNLLWKICPLFEQLLITCLKCSRVFLYAVDEVVLVKVSRKSWQRILVQTHALLIFFVKQGAVSKAAHFLKLVSIGRSQAIETVIPRLSKFLLKKVS